MVKKLVSNELLIRYLIGFNMGVIVSMVAMYAIYSII